VALAGLLGLVAYERHVGFFAPVWDRDGRHVVLLRRTTAGFVWGMGWEHFSPPASTYVLSDRLELLRLDPAAGRTEPLEVFEDSPLQGRVTHHYRGRIFNPLSARLEPGADGVEILAVMQVPRVPSSEQWSLEGPWAPDRASGSRWKTGWGGNTAAPEAVLGNGIELLAVRGRESFPAAVVAVERSGRYRVLLRNDEFDDLYPDGVPAKQLAERSSRPRIERARELRRVQGELVTQYRSQGASEGEAMLRAHDELEERGHLPKTPRLVASAVTEVPADVRVFDIPDEYFRVGLFQDIAAAIATLGEQVKTGTGTYLKYYDDETGPRLKAWRAAGNDRFAVRTGGRLYRLEVLRFDREPRDSEPGTK
jgi:hypothetical protein